MQPRIIGNADILQKSQAHPTVAMPLPGAVPVDTGLVVPPSFTSLPPETLSAIAAQVQATDSQALSLLQLATLGSEAEVALHQSLGAFLDRIERSSSPQIFKLVAELNRQVAEQDLPGLADRILLGKPGLADRLGALFRPGGAARAANAALEQLRQLVATRTATLASAMKKMEKEIEDEKRKALAEADTLEKLKNTYREHFLSLAGTTVLLTSLAHKAEQQWLAAQAGPQPDPSQLQELQDRAQALQSRALALEALFTKLPAEQLIIRQVQTAAVQTVQEVTTTTAARFASIKMTLLSLHASLSVQGLQRVAEQGAALDQNLQAVRARVVGNVVATAAHAPGDNRLREAEQLRAVVAQTRELQTITEQARAANAQKFEQARATLVQAREELTRLGATIRPDQPFNT